MRLKRISRDNAPAFIKESIRQLRFDIKYGNPTVFENREGILPNAGRHNTYYEYDVGQDRFGGRGRQRIIGLVDTGNRLLALYYTNDHYGEEWTEVVW